MPALCTEQGDTERNPRALEHEKADVVDGTDIEGDRHEDARCSDERQHPSTPKGVAEPGRDQQMSDEEKQEAEAEQDKFPGMSPVTATCGRAPAPQRDRNETPATEMRHPIRPILVLTRPPRR